MQQLCLSFNISVTGAGPFVTACAVATSYCISDEPCQWEKANFDPNSSVFID